MERQNNNLLPFPSFKYVYKAISYRVDKRLRFYEKEEDNLYRYKFSRIHAYVPQLRVRYRRGLSEALLEEFFSV
jgi:hypothetical protein